MLSRETKNDLMKRFPEIELSYDKVMHRKVFSDLCMVIPKGPKALIWITYLDHRNACIVLTLNSRGNVGDIAVCPLCFSNDLAYGTILYGTLFSIGKQRFFTCEDINFYKGARVERDSIQDKMKILEKMFRSELNVRTSDSCFLVPGLPVCTPNRHAAVEAISSLPYQVYGVKHFNMRSQSQSLGIEQIRVEVVPEALFRVKATLQADIYDIFCFEHGKASVPYGTAMVSTYESSVMMNGLFRTIKENRNLDLLEESDDEEEFENIREDKFVDLKKTLVMKCVYNRRFRKWEPREVVTEKTKLVTRKEASLLEKKV